MTEMDYYEKFSRDVEAGRVQPDPSTVRRNSGIGLAAILAATGTETWEEAEAVEMGRPRVGRESGPSPSVRTRVPQALKDRLDEYAREHGQKPSQVLRDALETYLKAA